MSRRPRNSGKKIPHSWPRRERGLERLRLLPSSRDVSVPLPVVALLTGACPGSIARGLTNLWLSNCTASPGFFATEGIFQDTLRATNKSGTLNGP